MRLLASGRDADVYELSAGKVLRRYRDAGKAAEPEAEVMRYARERGVPVPEVYDAAGPDLTMQRLVGSTMAAALTRRPWLLRREARRLAALHDRVHEVAAPAGLRRVGAGGALVHLDLHPDNVILTDDGPFLIDWANAAAGSPALDVADVWLVLSVAQLSGWRLRRAATERLARAFANAFVQATGLDYRSELETAAQRRLSDRNISEQERRRIAELAASAVPQASS